MQKELGRVILFEDRDGLCSYPAESIVGLTPAFPERVRIDTNDGLVGYCYEARDRLLPEICPASAREVFRPDQVRRIEGLDEGLRLRLEDGGEVRVTPAFRQEALEALGVDRYERQARGLTRVFLREYAFELARAPAALLREHFEQPRPLDC